MRIAHSLGLCAGLLISQQALAHETIPADWCVDPSMTPQVISTFELDGSDLIYLQGAMGLHLHTPVPGLDTDTDKCGIVDDWRLAQRVTQLLCAGDAPEGLAPMAYVTGPSSFIDERHHTAYTISAGVQGSCFVCAAPRR